MNYDISKLGKFNNKFCHVERKSDINFANLEVVCLVDI